MLNLVWRNLFKHPFRSLLTVGSLTIALFFLCFLGTMITTLTAGVESANQKRMWVQSAVSLFVDLPQTYQNKIQAVEGVNRVCKWQWFGGYYQDPSNFFAQFAVDPQELLDIWPELEIVDGTADGFLDKRTGCIIGQGLANEFGWRVGDTVPIIGGLHPRPDGAAWEFEVAAVYKPARATLDDRTLFFHWDYYDKSMEEFTGESPQVGVFVIEVEDGADLTAIAATVDGFFENGPQRVQTTSEAEFNRQFVSMVGNLPRLIGFIGAGVLVAILLACINTMLMAAREQVRDMGIMKALGFTDLSMFRLLLLQSMTLCCVGGGAGILLALGTQAGIATAMGRYFPGYAVQSGTLALAVGATVAIGFIAGLVPAMSASRLNAVEALRRGR